MNIFICISLASRTCIENLDCVFPDVSTRLDKQTQTIVLRRISGHLSNKFIPYNNSANNIKTIYELRVNEGPIACGMCLQLHKNLFIWFIHICTRLK